MRHPDVATAYWQASRVVALQRHGLLLLVGYLSPGFYYVHVVVCAIANIYEERHFLVFHLHHLYGGIGFLTSLSARHLKLQCHVAIGMSHGETRLCGAVESVGRICAVVVVLNVGNGLCVSVVESCTIINKLKVLAHSGIHYERSVWSSDVDVLSLQSYCSETCDKECR